MRVGHAAENSRHYPGWHTGENWHALTDETAGLGVCAVAAGEVVFASYDDPRRVAIAVDIDSGADGQPSPRFDFVPVVMTPEG